MIKKIDAVKYKANDYRVDKKGKRTPTKYAFWVKAGGVWTTAAESGDERAEQYRGVFSADAAALKLPEIIEVCGLEASDGVRRAAEEAETRLDEILRKREEREDATVGKGRAAYLAAKSESAIKSWDRLRARVEARAKADAAIIEGAANTDEDTDASAETVEA